MSNAPILLIIDDEKAILTTLKTALEDELYHVETLEDGGEALSKIGSLVPDLLLLDICMPNCNGLDLLLQIKKEYPHQKVIIMSGYGDIPTALKAVKRGAIDFIEKPLNLDEILSKISFLKSPSKENTASATIGASTKKLVGESFLFCELLSQAMNIAKTNLPVLITGEPGTGKRDFAQFIHENSLYADTPCHFVEGGSPDFAETLQAITKQRKKIVCITHIEDLSLSTQHLLATVIKQSAQNEHRFVCTANNSLFKSIMSGRFDSKLFQLINVVPLEIPPLRKRSYDIPLLIHHFLSKQAPHKTISTKSIRILRNQLWPGNVTELQNVIQRILTQQPANNTMISQNEIMEAIDDKESSLIDEQSFSRFRSLSIAKKEFEKNFLLHLLKKNLYNLNQVADQIELPLPHLKNKLLELNIKIPKGI
jgi:DNA-binding NtrC family response regulator